MASDWAEHFHRALTGARHPGDDIPAMLDGLFRALGSRKAVAAQLGVSPTTERRWRTGRQKPSVAGRGLAAATRRALLPADREREIRKGEGGGARLHVKGTVTVSGDTRPRVVRPGDYIPGPAMGRILSAWLGGDDAGAERLFWKATDRYYTAGMDIEPITDMWLED
jgi:hypothetical protein